MSQIIYTDGSCIPNPGSGGWAFVTIEATEPTDALIEWHVSGGSENSTNNRMELTAVIEALNFVKKTTCIIYIDSMYVINCAKGKWARKKNIDLWDEYVIAGNGKTIEWIWVKGHSGDKYNEIVDRLAKQEAKSI